MEQDELDPILIVSIYHLFKNEASNKQNSRSLSVELNKARKILIDEMFNIENNSLFTNLLSKMVQDKLIALNEE